MTETLLALLTPLGPYALLLLAAVAFAETALLIGVMLPADTMLVTAGVLVATGALQLPLWLWLVAVALAAVAGDQVAYLVGKRLAPRLRRARWPRCRVYCRRPWAGGSTACSRPHSSRPRRAPPLPPTPTRCFASPRLRKRGAPS